MTVEDFRRESELLQNNIKQFASRFAHAIEARPELRNELLDAGYSAEFLNRLENLGRGRMTPTLMFAGFPAARRLQSLPLSEQERALKHGVEVIGEDGSEPRMIPASDLTASQCRLAFSGDRIASLAEQRTKLQEITVAERRKVTVSPDPIQIAKGPKGQKFLRIIQPVDLTPSQVSAWLARIV